jgi:ubiquinone/menaquinone biosynthesis C-methylase UbiE
MNLTKTIKSITGTYKNLSTFGKILLFIICLLILLSIFRSNYSKSSKEGFEQKEQFIFKKGPSIYDNFYANVYDQIVNTNIESDFEIGTIINSTHPTSKSVILDVGCRTGSRVSKLSDKNLEVIGIDSSPFMIKKSLMKYPDYKFVVGNALKVGQFQPSSFTHILCLDHIIYTFEDKRQLVNNFIDWLMPGGYFVLNVVDIETFNPVSNNTELPIIVTTRKTPSKTIKARDYDYTANYTLNNNIGTIVEKFKFKNGNVRKLEHQLYMDDKEVILTIIQQCGFTLHSIVDVIHSGYGKQYIYIFVKP